MYYAHLIAMLDEQIERLQEARRILLSFKKLPDQPTKKRKSERPRAEQLNLIEGDSAVEPSPVSVSEPLQPRIIPPARRFRREHGPSKRNAASEPVALSAPVSDKPVFVSKDKLLLEQAQRERPQQGETTEQEEILSPEALMRRWLQSSAS